MTISRFQGRNSPSTHKMNSHPRTLINSQAPRILDLAIKDLHQFFPLALEEHARLLSETGRSVLKNAPESAVTIVDLPGYPAVCVKEFRWRGWLHALKGLFRPTQGVRTFRNGQRLQDAGIATALPLALMRRKILGLVQSEWVVMQVIPGAVELDRYIVMKERASWRTGDKRELARMLGRLIGSMHGSGIFHSDLKTCNILVSEGNSPTMPEVDNTHGSRVSFALLDYDEVVFARTVPEARKIKNLVQMFLSTPVAIAAADRLRFLREYARHAGINKKQRRTMARKILNSSRGKHILYVGFEGDVIEAWE
ncbi:MAG: lipopolysaccharide kinase InaA family protein [Deltaproteobacteria bacterium]